MDNDEEDPTRFLPIYFSPFSSSVSLRPSFPLASYHFASPPRYLLAYFHSCLCFLLFTLTSYSFRLLSLSSLFPFPLSLSPFVACPLFLPYHTSNLLYHTAYLLVLLYVTHIQRVTHLAPPQEANTVEDILLAITTLTCEWM